MLLLNVEFLDLFSLFENVGINLLWYFLFSEVSGYECIEMLEGIFVGDIELDILCIEGLMMIGLMGIGKFYIMGGIGKFMIEWVQVLVEKVIYMVVVGFCVVYGGIIVVGLNDIDVIGLQYDGEMCGGLLGKDFVFGSGQQVVNIVGCLIYLDWVIEILMSIVLGEYQDDDFDKFG